MQNIKTIMGTLFLGIDSSGGIKLSAKLILWVQFFPKEFNTDYIIKKLVNRIRNISTKHSLAEKNIVPISNNYDTCVLSKVTEQDG